MATVTVPASETKSLKDSEFKERLQELRRTDNYTNFFYLAAVWLYLALIIGTTIWFYEHWAAAGLSFWWNVPITLLAIVMIGAGQHNLAGLAHEATHHSLFSNRILNDLLSDWLCMFPLFSATHHFRLQHMAHHQFVNDPVRDPDVSQLKTSGHWLAFPLTKSESVRTLLAQLRPLSLIRYILIRARYNSVGTDKNPYLKKDWKPVKIPVRVGLIYMISMIGTLASLRFYGDPVLLAVVPATLWLAIMIFYALIPANWYHQSRIHPVISSRAMTMMRITFITALFASIAWIRLLTGVPAGMYFLLLWGVSAFTAFSFFMILRQIVQHGNGDRAWLTNTRVFFVNRLINFAVFPFGMEYHLPHHMFATVPHYKLPALHQLLMEYPEYQEHAVVVEGYFLPKHRPPVNPTVLDVLGSEYHHDKIEEIYVDNTVLENEQIEEKEVILQEGRDEAERLGVTYRESIL